MESLFDTNISFPEFFVLDLIRQVSADKTVVFHHRYIDPLLLLQANEDVIDVTGFCEPVLIEMMSFP
jgi:hypothetical protein